MAVFNSYVKLPEGIPRYQPSELRPLSLSDLAEWPNAAALQKAIFAIAV
jgi:hypothetical protein